MISVVIPKIGNIRFYDWKLIINMVTNFFFVPITGFAMSEDYLQFH